MAATVTVRVGQDGVTPSPSAGAGRVGLSDARGQEDRRDTPLQRRRATFLTPG